MELHETLVSKGNPHLELSVETNGKFYMFFRISTISTSLRRMPVGAQTCFVLSCPQMQCKCEVHLVSWSNSRGVKHPGFVIWLWAVSLKTDPRMESGRQRFTAHTPSGHQLGSAFTWRLRFEFYYGKDLWMWGPAPVSSDPSVHYAGCLLLSSHSSCGTNPPFL